MDIRGRNKINPNFNMSSMTDIVFLLLIFFMITSTLVTTSALDILLPKASGKTENKKSVSVSITKNLSYYIDNKQVSCETMIGELYSVLPALECLPLSIVDGPFKELNKLLRRDRSISEDRFEDLEIDDDPEDSSGTSDKFDNEYSEG